MMMNQKLLFFEPREVVPLKKYNPWADWLWEGEFELEFCHFSSSLSSHHFTSFSNPQKQESLNKAKAKPQIRYAFQSSLELFDV